MSRQAIDFHMDAAKKAGIPSDLAHHDVRFSKKKPVQTYDDENPTFAVYLRNGSVFYCHSTSWSVGSKFIDLFLWKDIDSGEYEFSAEHDCVQVRISEISHSMLCFLKENPK